MRVAIGSKLRRSRSRLRIVSSALEMSDSYVFYSKVTKIWLTSY